MSYLIEQGATQNLGPGQLTRWRVSLRNVPAAVALDGADVFRLSPVANVLSCKYRHVNLQFDSLITPTQTLSR